VGVRMVFERVGGMDGRHEGVVSSVYMGPQMTGGRSGPRESEQSLSIEPISGGKKERTITI
jgi:hypothetical protein